MKAVRARVALHQPIHSKIAKRYGHITIPREQFNFRDADFQPLFFEKMRDSMKHIEQQYTHRLNPTQPFVIRLDGHKFSSFCKYFQKPYDERSKYVLVRINVL